MKVTTAQTEMDSELEIGSPIQSIGMMTDMMSMQIQKRFDRVLSLKTRAGWIHVAPRMARRAGPIICKQILASTSSRVEVYVQYSLCK
jgi:hypothetical protein